MKLVMDEIYTPPLSDATPLVQKVRDSRPDVRSCCRQLPDSKLILER